MSGALVQPSLVGLVVKQSHGASENKHGNMYICVLCNLFQNVSILNMINWKSDNFSEFTASFVLFCLKTTV